MKHHRAPAMTTANDESLARLIGSAQQRVVYMAPSLTMPVANTLARQLQRLGPDRVHVIVDVDPEVCRLGYGEIEALRMVEKIARMCGGMVHAQPGVRIGLVIADDQTVVYAPTPLLIEASPGERQKQLKPNAVCLGLPPADLERDLGLGPDGVAEQTIGLDKAQRLHIEQTAKDLETNPPQRFDIARSIRVFNAHFQFAELSIKGLALDRKRIVIPSDLLGIDSKDEHVRDALRLTMSLIDRRHSAAMKRLQRIRMWISHRYLTRLPHYGSIVSVTDKPKLEQAVLKLEKLARRVQRRVIRDLRREIEQKREALLGMLLPAVQHNRPKRWDQRPYVGCSDKARLEWELNRAMLKVIKQIGCLEVRLVFKGVTYDMLTDETFLNMVRIRHPGLSQLHEEHSAALGKEPQQRDNPRLKGAA
jgi:hypothetical protein